MCDNETLLDELCKAAKQTRTYGWRNYFFANIVAAVAVIGSISATILAALGNNHRVLTAVFAAIPAAVLAVNTTFNFERKAIWHWRTTKRFEGLIRKLRYEGTPEDQVSKEFSEIDAETFDGWAVYSSLSKGKDESEL